jgi:hypothetical protein
MHANHLLLAASAVLPVIVQAQAVECTTNSVTIPSWFVQDLKSSGASSGGNVTFSLLNRATKSTVTLACQTGGSAWNTCTAPGSAASNSTILASIQLSGSSASLLLNETWTCTDRVGTKPYVIKFPSIDSQSYA